MFYLRSTLIFPIKFCIVFTSPMCTTRIAHLTLHDTITLIIFDDVYKLWSTSLYNFLQPAFIKFQIYFLITRCIYKTSYSISPKPKLNKTHENNLQLLLPMLKDNSLSLSLSHTHTHTLTLSLSHTHTHSHSHTHTRTLTLSHTHIHIHSHSLSHTLTLTFLFIFIFLIYYQSELIHPMS